jgi:ubiquinone/menaquinone biosynthesis C-methylase UbiE
MTEPRWAVFDRDAREHSGYFYTATDRLSSNLATQRTTDAILESGRFEGRSVLDVGCGDGYYTIQFWDSGMPGEMIGLDAAAAAVSVANQNRGDRPISFDVGDSHALPYPDNRFDLVLVQSILHHDDNPTQTIREAFRVAPEVLIHEPNGNNLGLKVIERVSKYHREHEETSYTSRRMRRWVRDAGGTVITQRFAGFVPMFSPDWLARMMKRLEPTLERTPILNALGCSVYIVVARRSEGAASREV